MTNGTQTVGFDNLSNLSVQLTKVEPQQLGANTEIRQSREVLIAAIEGHRHSTYELGRGLRLYKAHYKAGGRWMEAAQIVAKALGCDERTVFRLIDNYERVVGLPAITIDALQDQDIDPAAPKKAPIIESLFRIPIQETREQAAVAVAGAVSRYIVQKKNGGSRNHNTGNLEEFARKVVKQFKDRYQSRAPQDRDEEVQYVLERVVNTLRVPITELCQFSRPALVPKPRSPKTEKESRSMPGEML
jgi:hypothetical protein